AGVFGVSAIVASVNAALAGLVIVRAWRAAVIVAAAVLLVAVWGNAHARDAALTRQGRPLRVGIVQPNVLEEEIETPGRGPENLLVPGVGALPVRDWLNFAGPLVRAIGSGFDAGDTLTLLPLGAHQVSTAICYEIIYPDLVRRFVSEGSELLTTITNDSWFGA